MAGLLSGLTTAQQIEAIYVAYFGRAGDGPGYLYWQNQAQTQSLTAIANGFSVQPEAKAMYAFLATPPAALSPTDPVQIASVDTFINQVYENLFNRTADSPGLAYWQGQILTGAVSIGTAVYSIANGATGTDATTLTNKAIAAVDFTQVTFADNLGTTTPLSASFLAAAHASVAPVTSSSSTVTASEAATQAYVNQPFEITDNAGGSVNTSATPTATTGGHIAEGSVLSFTVLTPAGTADNTVEHYVLTGTGSALSQVSSPLSGDVTVHNGTATVTVNTVANVLGGANPTLTLTLSNPTGTLATDVVTINEAQQAIASALSVNEGSTTNFTVSTSGVSGALVANTQESYTLSGSPNLAQIPVAERSGVVTLDQNGQAVVTIHTAATVFNSTAAPTVTMNLLNAGGTVSSTPVTINEVALLSAADNAAGSHTTTATTVGSQTVETTTGGAIVDGQSLTFTVSTTGVSGAAVAGTQESWTLSGTALSEVAGPTSGVVTLDANGTASVTVQTNFSTSAAGNLTFAINTNNVVGVPDVVDTVTVNAATQTIAPPPSVTSVNEGSSINFSVNTTGVSGVAVAGTQETYTIIGTGTALAQLASPQTGTVTLDANGHAVVPLSTLATVFNSTAAPTYTVTLNNGAAVLPSTTVTLNETAIIAAADNAGGTTVQGNFGNLVTETTTGGAITDGSSITFTIAASGVAGAAVANTQEAWTLSDLGTGALSQVVGATSGTVTLDANGNATVTVQTSYSAISPFSGGSLQLSLTALPVTDTVTVNLPPLLYFTTAPNERLVGGNQDTTFIGVVDSITVGNNTMSNGESAQGQTGHHNTLDVLVNSAPTDVQLGSLANPDSNIQVVNVTDLNSQTATYQETTGTYFNMQYVPNLELIETSASDVGFDQFFNVQTLANVTVSNSDYAGQGNLQIYVVDDPQIVAGGEVTVTLQNAGSFDFTYQRTNGADLVTAFNFANVGDNYVNLIGAQVTQSITVNGTGGLWLHLDTGDNAITNRDENRLYFLTSVDASGLGGPIPITDNYQFGFDAVDIYQGHRIDPVTQERVPFTFVGALGNTFVDLQLEVSHPDGTQVYGLPSDYQYWAQGGTFTITVNGTATSGNNWVRIDSDHGNSETITVNNGGMNTSNTTTGDHNGGDKIDLHGWEAVSQTLSVIAPAGANGNNQINIVSADNANVTVTQGNGNNNIDIDLWNGQVWGTAAAVVAVTVLDGSNDIHINTDKDGASGDYGSNVTVTAGDGINNDIHIHEGYNSTTTVTVGSGNGTDVHVENYGGSSGEAVANITVGSGSGIVVGYHDNSTGWDNVTILLGASDLGGDTGAGGTVWADVGQYSVLTENLGSGGYTLHNDVAGSHSSVTIQALDLAGGGDTIDVGLGLDGTVLDSASITMGGGDNTINVWQHSSGTSSSAYAEVQITTQDAVGAGNTIFVDLDGSYDEALVTVGNGNNTVTVVDTSSLTGDYVNILAGNGTNHISVDLSGVTASTVIVNAGSPTSTGNDTVSVVLDSVDATSSATIHTGGGNDTIAVTGTQGGSAVTVTAGAGDDWVGVDSLTLPSNVHLDGGAGYNTLGLLGDVTALNSVALVAATISNFQALELTSMMTQDVDVLDLGAGNNINQVILDNGYTNADFSFLTGWTTTLSGLNNHAELDFLWGQSGSGTLLVPIGNSLFNPGDTVSILLDSQATFNSSHHFGEVVLYDTILFGAIPPGAGPVETVNITSTAAVGIDTADDYSQVTNYFELDDQGIQTLNINGVVSPFAADPNNTPPLVNDATGLPFHNGAIQDGDVYLNLDGSILTGLATVNANTFYAGIQDTDSNALGSSGWGTITFNAVHTTEDNLVFGNAGGDTVLLGNYDNTVTMGNGNSDVLTMTHTSNVYGSADGNNTVTVNNGNGATSGNYDVVTLGNGNNNTVTMGNIASDNGRDLGYSTGSNHPATMTTNIHDETITLGDGSGDTVTLGSFGTHTINHTGTGTFDPAATSYYYGGSGTNNSITIGDGLGTVTNAHVTINGSGLTNATNTTPLSATLASVDTVTFNGSGGGGNTVTLNFATGSTVNLGNHTTGDTLIFNHIIDSAFGYNDTVNGFIGGAGGDTINLSALDSGFTVSHGVQQANGALAVLGLLNSDALDVTHAAVIYDYAAGILYDFHGAVNSTNVSATNTLEIQLAGTHLGVNTVSLHNVIA